MLIFNPSKMKFFKKTDDGEPEEEEGVKTFFDSLDLGSKGGGGKTKPEEDEDELDEGEEEEEEDNDEDEDDEDESKISPELKAMQEQLKLAQEQNAKLMAMLEKQPKDEKDEESLEDPFQTEAFDNLATSMDWDDDERKAMKSFMKMAFDYQKQTTLSTATEGITDIVNSSMSQAEKKRAVREQFFTENPKLKPVKDYVSTVASGVLKEYKALGKPLDPAAILNEAASRAYKTLGIDPKAKGKKDNDSESESDPAFPSTKGGSKRRKPGTSKTRTQKMITSLINL
jgi:hypothetical protein